LKISGPNFFSNAGQVQQLNELNLKSSQKVVGKIISIDQNEAFLELAGHTILAKIEGEPPEIGTNQTFLVSYDTEGRTILKMVKNSPAAADNQSDSYNLSLMKTAGSSGETSLQKAIVSALMKDNQPVTPENVTKIARSVQEFQSVFQQPIEPEVFSFMIAQKWPLTPGTLLAAWINQEPEIRDILRKKLQEGNNQGDGNSVLSALLKLPGNISEITKKLKSASELQFSQVKNEKDFNSQEQMVSVSDSDSISKKLQWLLEQNISIHKTLLKDTNIGNSTNLIPLLVVDSKSNIHECFIEWKKEKGSSSQNNTNYDQSIQVAIPTENLGIVNLGLKIGANGIQVNLGVVSEDVRQYLRTHAPEIKSVITANAKENVIISVKMLNDEKPYPKARGVDLWM
jgi:hypothetical protein